MRSLTRRSAVLSVLVVLPACGGGGGGPTNPGGNTPPFVITVVRQAGSQSFNPNPASAGGREVVFRNTDTVVHHVIFNDGTVDTGDIAPGATSRTIQMPSVGTNYHCTIHPTMVGRVSAEGGPPPPCTGVYC